METCAQHPASSTLRHHLHARLKPVLALKHIPLLAATQSCSGPPPEAALWAALSMLRGWGALPA